MSGDLCCAEQWALHTFLFDFCTVCIVLNPAVEVSYGRTFNHMLQSFQISEVFDKCGPSSQEQPSPAEGCLYQAV